MNATLEKKAKTKSYFVKDESLHGVDNDRFNYADIAHVLDETISTNEPPYNIAIIGKWGEVHSWWGRRHSELCQRTVLLE